MIVIKAGSSIELQDQAMDLVETRLKYRFEYQTFFDDTLYTIDSNEFTIQQEWNLGQCRIMPYHFYIAVCLPLQPPAGTDPIEVTINIQP